MQSGPSPGLAGLGPPWQADAVARGQPRLASGSEPSTPRVTIAVQYCSQLVFRFWIHAKIEQEQSRATTALPLSPRLANIVSCPAWGEWRSLLTSSSMPSGQPGAGLTTFNFPSGHEAINHSLANAASTEAPLTIAQPQLAVAHHPQAAMFRRIEPIFGRSHGATAFLAHSSE